MSGRKLGAIGAAASLVFGAGAFAGPPSLVIVGMTPGDMSADATTICGSVYDARINEYVVYQYTRSQGSLRTEAFFKSGQVRASADASAMCWGANDAENVCGFGTNRTNAHRWTISTGSVNLGMAPTGYNCDFNVNTPYDISGNGRYVVGGGWTDHLCGPFRAFRYDSQAAAWELLPGSVTPPPFNIQASATRANACSFDGSVVGGYDQNYDPALSNSSRHASVWVKTGGTWNQTVLDWYGGEIYDVSADGNTVVGEMSTTTMNATFGTTVTTPVRWVRSGSSWIPHNMGGDGGMSPVAVSADGGTVVGLGGGSGFIWRQSINGGVAMSLASYVASQGGSFPGFAIASAAGSPIHAISADGNAVLISGMDSRNPCLSTGTTAVLYLNGTTCEPPGVNFSPISQFDPAGPSSFGMIMNVFATGSWPLDYQWQRETSPGSGVWDDLVDDNCGTFNAAYFNFRGTTTCQLRVGALDGSWPGRYRCVVSNSCGSATSAVAAAAVCSADYNCDGFIDPLDYNAFINDFEAGSLNADFNGDGFLDPLDYNGFINSFEAGC